MNHITLVQMLSICLTLLFTCSWSLVISKNDTDGSLEKRASALADIWDSIPGAQKVTGNSAIYEKIDRTKDIAYGITYLYGCTGILISDPDFLILAHMAEEGTDSNNKLKCQLGDTAAVKKFINGPLLTATSQNDATVNTQVTIIYGTGQSGNIAGGLALLKDHIFDSFGLENQNQYIVLPYPSSSGTGEPVVGSPSGRAVVQWVRGDGGGNIKAWYFLDTPRRNDFFADPPTSVAGGQQLALATYIDPGANPDTWNRIIGFPALKVSIVVANVVNGPDSAVNQGWTDVIPRAAASGKTVLGYVRTGYLGVSSQQFTTRLGSSKTSDWVAQIQEDVDQWYKLYPGQMGGIFFDEAWNDCGANNVNAELYKFITQSTKRKYPNAFTVLNPGAPMPQCFEHSADTLLTAEVSYSTYTSSAFVPNDWTPSDPRKLWHIIYDVPIDQSATVATLAKERGIGLLHITNDVEPNPYDTVPDDAYMQELMDAISGGEPFYEDVFDWPEAPANAIDVITPFLTLKSFDYSSAAFSWGLTANAIGFRLYQDSTLILELAPTMTAVTVGGLTPGQSYVFGLAAITGDGTSSSMSNTISLSTTPLPGNGHTVASTSVSMTATQTTYHAQILVPYAYVRIFIFQDATTGSCFLCPNTAVCDPNSSWNPGWTINYSQYSSVCNHYMIEGAALYSYSGFTTPESTSAPWSWTRMADVSIMQDGYEYTWVMPIGSNLVDTRRFLVQVQGYGPSADAFGDGFAEYRSSIDGTAPVPAYYAGS